MELALASRRNDHTAILRFASGSTFHKVEKMLNPGESLSIPVPDSVLYVLTGDGNVKLTITWADTNEVREFRVNKMMMLSDVSDIASISLTNNDSVVLGVRAITF
jgi:hypothetical protein